MRQVRVHSQRLAIGFPVIPICLPIGGSRRHSARSKRFVSGIEITFVEVESLLKVGIPFNKSVEVVGNEH